MSCLNLRTALCAVLCATALAAHAGEVRLVSARQTRPGEVVARIDFTGPDKLQAADLRLRLDDGREASAAALAMVPADIALLLCLDRSGSMGASAVGAMQGALRESLASGDGVGPLPFRAEIVAFGTRLTPLVGSTTDPARIRAALVRLDVERQRDGKTLLYEAVAGGLARLRDTDARVKRLIVVSDGNDEGSQIPQAAVVQIARNASITIDAIGFGPLAEASSGSLSTLAGITTDGRFARAATQPDLAAALKRMIRQAASATEFDATFRYDAATDGRTASAPVLLYRPASGASAALPMPAGLAAMAAAAPAVAVTVASEPASAASGTQGPSGTLNWLFELLFKIKVTFPQLPWIIGGLVLALLVLLLFVWLRKRRPTAPSVAPSPPPSLPPTFVNPPPPPPPPPPKPPGRRETMVSFRWPLPGQGRTVALLRVTAGIMKGRQFPVAAAKVHLGSARDNDIVIDGDDYVSSHHAMLRAEAGGLYLVDVGSANGTDLNGSRFKDGTRALSPLDRFTLGRTTLEVTAPDARPPRDDPAGFEQRVR